jgi:hypothetical protein
LFVHVKAVTSRSREWPGNGALCRSPSGSHNDTDESLRFVYLTLIVEINTGPSPMPIKMARVTKSQATLGRET